MPNQNIKPKEKVKRIYSEDFLFVMACLLVAALALFATIAAVHNQANCIQLIRALENVTNSQIQGILANAVQLNC